MPSDRSKVWRKIKQSKGLLLSPKDAKIIDALCTGSYTSWIDMIPNEWIDIYSAMYDESDNYCNGNNDKSIKSIDKDVNRTFTIYQRSTSIHEDTVTSLRKALVVLSHHIEYCQGMNFIAAALLVKDNNAKNAFVVLSYLLIQCNLVVLFNFKYSSLMEYLKLFQKRLRRHNKVLYKHFLVNNFSSYIYAIEWFTTCFVVSNSIELAPYIIDLLLHKTSDCMIRIGLSILDILSQDLLDCNEEQLQQSFKSKVMKLNHIDVIVQSLDFTYFDFIGKTNSDRVCYTRSADMLSTMVTNINQMTPTASTAEYLDTMQIVAATDVEVTAAIDLRAPNAKPSHQRNLNYKEIKKKLHKRKSRGYNHYDVYDYCNNVNMNSSDADSFTMEYNRNQHRHQQQYKQYLIRVSAEAYEDRKICNNCSVDRKTDTCTLVHYTYLISGYNADSEYADIDNSNAYNMSDSSNSGSITIDNVAGITRKKGRIRRRRARRRRRSHAKDAAPSYLHHYKKYIIDNRYTADATSPTQLHYGLWTYPTIL